MFIDEEIFGINVFVSNIRNLIDMRIFSILLIVFLTLKTSFSQEKLKDGYLITLENDTIDGKIKYRERASYWQLEFLTIDNKRKLYKAGDINGYMVNNKYFESCYVFPGYYFLERIMLGRINLYKTGNTYYIKKDTEDIIKINEFIQRSILKEKISDNKELLTLIEQNKYIDTLSIEYVVQRYNSWAIQNSEQNIVSTIPVKEKEDTILSQLEVVDHEKIPKQKLLNLKLKVLVPGIGIETKISNTASIYIEGGSGSSLGNFGFYLYPFIKFQPRLYTNIKKRADVGKNVDKFSGDYISPYFLYIPKLKNISANEENLNVYGLCYGLQRKKGTVFYWGIDLGAGIMRYTSSDRLEPYFISDFNFGFVF